MFKNGIAVPVQLLASLEAEAVAASNKAAADLTAAKEHFDRMVFKADCASDEVDYRKEACAFVKSLEALKESPLVVGDLFQSIRDEGTCTYVLEMFPAEVGLVRFGNSNDWPELLNAEYGIAQLKLKYIPERKTVPA